MATACIFVILPLCLALAAFTDLFEMTIPNRLSAILLIAFAVVAFLAGLTGTQVTSHVVAAILVFAVCFCLFAANIMGGGDVKLLTASAIWFGLNLSLAMFLLYVAIFGGMLTVAVLLLRAKENIILAAGIPVPRLLLTAKKIPYGIAIALGGFAAYPSSPLMQLAFAQLS